MGVAWRHNLQVRNYSVLVRPLSISETLQVVHSVAARLQAQPLLARTSALELSLLAKETLIVASTSDVGMQDAMLTEYLLDMLTPDELTHLYKQYSGMLDKVNPSLEDLKPEEMKALVEMVKKNPTEAIELSFLQLVNVVRFLVTSGG
jgi:hypothetical protein